MRLDQNDRIAVLGGSKGLGKAILAGLQKTSCSLICISRTASKSEDSKIADFSKEEAWASVIEELVRFAPTRIIYSAGGGPFGKHLSKEWKDHLWSYRVNFLFPSYLLLHSKKLSELQQMIFIGSAVAESSPDPMAASYAAGKAALRNLILSVQLEEPELDIRLFSPGYMDTQLLPPNAWPRRRPEMIKSADEVAQIFLDWMQTSDDTQRHLMLT